MKNRAQRADSVIGRDSEPGASTLYSVRQLGGRVRRLSQARRHGQRPAPSFGEAIRPVGEESTSATSSTVEVWPARNAGREITPDAARLRRERTAPADSRPAAGVDELRRLIERALDEAVPTASPRVLSEAMRYSLLAGGKRLRPILCLAACEAAGGAVDAALPAAVAIEMIHTMSLIHDDLPAMDNASLRRGRPTNHLVFGEAIALLSGDALLPAAFQHVITHSAGVPAERVLAVIREIATAMGTEGMAGGQALDLMHARQGLVSVRALDEQHMRKTASLIESALVCGGLLGGADALLLAQLRHFGRSVGLALQIADDVIDVTKTAEQIGKLPGGDEAAGRATYATTFGIDPSRRRVRELLEEAEASIAAAGAAATTLRRVARLVLQAVEVTET